MPTLRRVYSQADLTGLPESHRFDVVPGDHMRRDPPQHVFDRIE
jgi:hypothetical protein